MDPVRLPQGELDLDQAHTGSFTHAPNMCSRVVPVPTILLCTQEPLLWQNFSPKRDVFSWKDLHLTHANYSVKIVISNQFYC